MNFFKTIEECLVHAPKRFVGTRPDGSKILIKSQNPSGSPMVFYYTPEENYEGILWQSNFSILEGIDFKEEIDWDEVEIGTKIRVSCFPMGNPDSSDGLLENFAKYEDGMIYTFTLHGVIPWKYGILA